MKKTLSIIISTVFATVLHAQNGINTPYSRYGFGIQSERALGFNKGMGGVAQGFRNGQQINIANPASYSAVDSLTALFDMGISLQNGNYKMGNLQQNVRNSSFDYFAFQFRAFKHVGVTIGLMPITNIKYNFSSSNESLQNNEEITSTYKFNGDGGLHELTLGMGWQPFKPISFGLNVSYIWGDYTHNMSMSFSESSAFSMSRIYKADISTYSIQGGLQYIQPIGKKDQLVVGGTYTLGHKTDNDAFRITRTMNSAAVENETNDTIKHAFQLPTCITAGFTYYHANKLRVGVDFELQKWSLCMFPNQQTGIASSSYTGHSDVYSSTKGQLNDRVKVAAGMDWTPNESSSKFFNRCTYKLGGYYAQTYAKADITETVTQKPSEIGVSAGVSLPLSNSNTYRISPKINVAVQWVHTNIPYLNAVTSQKSTLTENYFRFCLGVTFSERWFQKWKVQ